VYGHNIPDREYLFGLQTVDPFHRLLHVRATHIPGQTFILIAADENMPVTLLADITGHSLEMLLKAYRAK
jgi:hypothetical protein